eukprot:6175956-Pleurochrysis_carterae.AAC.2
MRPCYLSARHTLFFSAQAVIFLTQLEHSPVSVVVHECYFCFSFSSQSHLPTNFRQNIEFLKENKKKDKLLDLLQNGPPPPIIVFCNGKKGCDVLARSLDKMGFPTAVIHSGKDQATREAAIEGFKSGEFEILVATDIAGRGIDIQGVEHVINYDMPKDIESYTHRIGRTGRAGKKGIATTFVTGEGVEENVLYDLVQMLK